MTSIVLCCRKVRRKKVEVERKVYQYLHQLFNFTRRVSILHFRRGRRRTRRRCNLIPWWRAACETLISRLTTSILEIFSSRPDILPPPSLANLQQLVSVIPLTRLDCQSLLATDHQINNDDHPRGPREASEWNWFVLTTQFLIIVELIKLFQFLHQKSSSTIWIQF